MIGQSIKMAWKSIASNKVRTFLTMLGIIIGVMSLVVLVSLVSGATDSVNNSISSMGTNLLTVSITDDKEKPIKLEDLSEIVAEKEISAISPVTQTSMTVSNGSTEETATIYGVGSSYQEIQGLELSYGRFLKKIDITNHTDVVVISQDIAIDVIGRINVVGENIKLNGIKYMIIGVLKEKKTSHSTSSVYEAYIPFSAMIRQSDEVSSSITRFCVSATSEDTLDEAESKLEEYLLKRFDYDEDAFSIMNQSAIMETMESVNQTFTILLGGIAGISLLVGGIGIMNIMLVSVTERTREIGIRKAIGAGRGTIMFQFLLEALMISMMGCAIGIVLSWTTLKVVAIFASSYNLSFQLSVKVVAIAVIFSVAIGVIFGLYPANKAAKKNPIEALRYMG